MNIRVTPNNAAQDEPSVAVNLQNPNTIIATANDFRLGPSRTGLYRSTDKGKTWTNTILPLPAGFTEGADGVVNYGGDNFFLVSGVVFNRDAAGNGIDTTTVVYRSTNNGQTFSAPIIVNRGAGAAEINDKNWSAIDISRKSRFRGRAYISYTQFTANGSQILFQNSTNGGVTWSAPIPISAVTAGNTFVQGSNLQVGPRGEVYVAWLERQQFNNGNVAFFRIRRSNDGGVTFGPIVTVSQFAATPFTLNANVPTWQFRASSNAYLAVDTSKGRFKGRVYAVWQDYSTGNSHILASHSDNGVNWTTPVRVDSRNPENTQNFWPFPVVTLSKGTVKVIYYSNRVAGTNLLDVFVSESSNGGKSFRNNKRITTQSSNPGNTQFMGDYIFAAINPSEGLVAVWTDFRTGNQDIFIEVQSSRKRKGPKH
ncbi:exo-alpha-sialidase [Bacillus sp. DNRA2]|uniref:sialidase family protein n=1 Tax=Bacillus sp. DNRA2 TaxID=2723053 RepID=UPI00145D5B96|nr:sialidase family protein [Bacillus sp. DNRA2]NMD71758.1 exo-alpha-sialidase [Bacillus sp. DNRA2]